MKKIIAVTSGVEGVGKTCIALNLSVALQKSGASVCVLEAGSGVNTSASLIGVDPDFTFLDFLKDGVSLDKVFLEGPLGVTIIPGCAGFQKLAGYPGDTQMKIAKEIKALEKFDYMIVDTPSGLSAENIALSRAADLVVAVYNKETDAITQALVCIKLLLSHNYSKEAMLAPNMLEPGAGSEKLAQRVEKASKANISQRIKSFPILYMDDVVARSVADKKPFMETSPQCPASVGIEQISASVLENNNIDPACDPAKYIFDVAKYSIDSNLAANIDKQKSYQDGEDKFKNRLLKALGLPPVKKAKTPEKISAKRPAVESQIHLQSEPSPAVSKYIVDIFEKNVQAQEKILTLLENMSGGHTGRAQEKIGDKAQVSVPEPGRPSGKTFFLDFDEYLLKQND
ncbi:hypothetical protein MNBD_NITROSPINAE02-277 [hydrothermal vent metagenome]|uniref:CobQ/CobB/MinD/ParA nucleotide binding domain-containing protein n=1 Tax=hydrothermal vent metagenome TaxID=652676 RepID=A0A3B1C231_9ZZZZ